MTTPKPLQKGDTIGIAASARFVKTNELEAAISSIESRGFRVALSPTLFAQDRQFGGSDKERINGLQKLIDNPAVKAIWFARGGYGTARIIDHIDFSALQSNPKWFIGFSDLTVLLNHLANKQIPTLHAGMALQADPANNLYSAQDLSNMFALLNGASLQYPLPAHPFNKPGNCSGTLVGGNLSVLYSTLGTASFPNLKGKLLFLEDLDEYLYHLDRMMLNLKRNGLLADLAGLIVGGMTDMNDNTVPFGKTAEEIIAEHTQRVDYPLYFGFEAGHCVPNHPLTIGSKVKIENNILFLPPW